MAAHNDFGKKAEQLACDFLSNKGYRIIERNYRYQRAEIDIIARKGDVLSIIEVKARTNIIYGKPENFITQKKIQLIGKAANHYVIDKEMDVEVRFDIISIVSNSKGYSIDFIENAFYYY